MCSCRLSLVWRATTKYGGSDSLISPVSRLMMELWSRSSAGVCAQRSLKFKLQNKNVSFAWIVRIETVVEHSDWRCTNANANMYKCTRHSQHNRPAVISAVGTNGANKYYIGGQATATRSSRDRLLPFRLYAIHATHRSENISRFGLKINYTNANVNLRAQFCYLFFVIDFFSFFLLSFAVA